MPQLQAEPRLSVTDPNERAQLEALVAPEKSWYAHHRRFEDIGMVMGAVSTGALVRVTGNSDFVPIARLRSPGTERIKPPFLLPASAAALRAVMALSVQRARAQGIAMNDLRYAVTSLVRTEQMQASLVQSGALAVEGSTHCVGAPFDVDASGYYRTDLEMGLVSVVSPLRDRDGMRSVERHLRGAHGGSGMRIAPEGEYDERVAQSLLDVTSQLHDMGYINRVLEFPDTGNQALHLCPNPDVTIDDWRSMQPEPVAATDLRAL
ncbi:hypothetical protein E6P97_03670 [Patescibacteria group bacterium]|nr:MAG: hypothetical protein E6P97_03670 [Patescibacteria group bacterium]